MTPRSLSTHHQKPQDRTPHQLSPIHNHIPAPNSPLLRVCRQSLNNPSSIPSPDFNATSYHSTRYTDGPDTESHIHSFLSMSQANHSTQRLTIEEVDGCPCRMVVLLPQSRGVYHNPRCLHPVSRVIPSGNSEARTAPRVLYHFLGT